jgi:hypothetical protein
MSQKGEVSKAETIKAEHTSLDREIAAWRQWWEALDEMGQPRFGEMGRRLAEFQAHLVTHVSHEESLLSKASAQFAKELPRLRGDHATLLSELDRLIERLRACEPDFECWGAARRDFEQFLDRLQAHEVDEEQLFERIG